LEFLDGDVEMPESKFRGAQIRMPRAHVRIARTEPHRLQNIVFGLLEAAEFVLDPARSTDRPASFGLIASAALVARSASS
jgi:hypothetical protein